VCQLSHGKLLADHVTGEGSLFDVPPAAIGRYRVQHPLGAGTCGPVFRGESPEATPVAIKLLTIPVRPERVGDVLDGLQTLVTDGIGVPGTVEPLDAGLHEGTTPFLVTTLAQGDSLDVALRRFGPALLADVLPRLATLAAALDRLAASGLHHGTLHLRDVIVDADTTHMTGVGVWQALAAGGVRLPRRSPYRAPELADHAMSAAGDLFSLAAVAYEWITGRRAPAAFVAGDMAASVGPRREALGAVFARAMHLDPSQRHPSCTAFVEDLARVDGGETDAAAPSPSVDERPRRRSRPAPEPLPLLTLEPEAAVEAEMPLQAASMARDAEGVVPDLPLQSVSEPFADAVLEAAPVDDALGASPVEDAWSGMDVGAVPDGDLPDRQQAQASGVTTVPLMVDDGRDTDDGHESAHQVWHGEAGADDVPVGAGEMPLEGPPSPARPSVSTDTGLTPPRSAAAPQSDTWMARLLLMAVGAALGLSVGYAVWGRQAPHDSGAPSTDVVGPDRAGAPEPSASASSGAPGMSAAAATTDAPLAQNAAPAPAVAPTPPAPPTDTPPPASSAPAARATTGEAPGASAATVTPRARARRDAAAARARVTPARLGSVRATSTPPGAMVMLDGKLVGKSPMTVRSLAPGRHTIEFRRQGHRPVTLQVQVEAGASARVSATLPRAQEPQ
jgi:hypothetical protein